MAANALESTRYMTDFYARCETNGRTSEEVWAAIHLVANQLGFTPYAHPNNGQHPTVTEILVRNVGNPSDAKARGQQLDQLLRSL